MSISWCKSTFQFQFRLLDTTLETGNSERQPHMYKYIWIYTRCATKHVEQTPLPKKLFPVTIEVIIVHFSLFKKNATRAEIWWLMMNHYKQQSNILPGPKYQHVDTKPPKLAPNSKVCNTCGSKLGGFMARNMVIVTSANDSLLVWVGGLGF